MANPILGILAGAALATSALSAATNGLDQWTLPEKPPGPHFRLTSADIPVQESFRSDQPIVGTYYFYWYDIESKAHVFYEDGGDALTTHPSTLEGFSYKLPSWHRQQLEDMMAAGIDFLLPVYWGVPGFYSSWSFAGLPPLVQAHDELLAEGKKPPRIGLFYDTSTLQHNPLQAHIDLSTPKGKDWLYGTIRDFFSLIPPTKWAMIEGRPIVILYTGHFAKKHDPAALDEVRVRFRRDFGVEPYLIKSPDFQGQADATYSWGAALRPNIFDRVCAVGAGYDHSAVRGRQPLVRDREGGAFYENSWRLMLQRSLDRRPRIIMLETWNEFHEGTDICRSREYGTQYIELTRKYADMWHAGQVLPRTGKYAQAASVSFRIGATPECKGLDVPLDPADGPMFRAFAAGSKCLRSTPNPHNPGYVYFRIDNSFLFDEPGVPVTIVIEYRDCGTKPLVLEYDSADPKGSVHGGAFKAGGSVQRQGTGEWREATFVVKDGRFADRCNGNDFRLSILGDYVDIRAARVTPQ